MEGLNLLGLKLVVSFDAEVTKYFVPIYMMKKMIFKTKEISTVS